MSGLLAVRRVGVSGVPRASVLAWLPSGRRRPTDTSACRGCAGCGKATRNKENDERDVTVMDNGGKRLREADDELGGRI